MGGLVFNKDRVSYDYAISVASDIINKIKNNSTILISSYHMPKYKETYGDLDFVVYLNNNNIDDIINILSPDDFVSNKKILQLLYKGIQIDINIVNDKDSFEFASNMVVHSVLPAFISYILPLYSNFRFNLNGIYSKHYSNVIRKNVNCLVTKDVHLVLDSIGISHRILNRNIGKEDVINLILESKFIPDSSFSKKSFYKSIENKEGTSYCHSYLIEIFNALSNRDIVPSLKDCENHFYLLFNNKRTDLKEKEKLEDCYNKSIMFKKVFNGKIINKISKIKGKDIGYVINYYNSLYTEREELITYILSLSEEEFKNDILSIIKNRGDVL